MNGKLRITQPRYQEIARDIAAKIAEGTYPIGEKIYARSAVASQYGVSSETARRAMCVLDDLGIVDSSRGSGVTILSAKKARAFVQQYRDFSTIQDLRAQLMESVDRQRRETEQFNGLLDELVEKADRFRASNPFVPFQTTVRPASGIVGKTLADSNFWHNTQATVVAIRRGERLLLSPGPYIVLQPGDVLWYIGDEACVDRVNALLKER